MESHPAVENLQSGEKGSCVSGRRLFDFARAAGCAGKVCQEDLLEVLEQLPAFADTRLLVGGETSDDAGVYAISEDTALVLTVDVLTPVAEDPGVFGQIAAANALSDVYAMGGKPLAALCIVGFPVGEVEHQTIRKMLSGVWEKVKEAGAVVAGGHTTKDVELKCGLAVTGLVHPGHVITNAGAKPGDVLLLTKPLGIGLITTAARANVAGFQTVQEANRVMCRLNRLAAEVMCEVGVHAATDVTGFGLLGHAWEMAQASRGDVEIYAGAVPLIPGVIELAKQRLFPVGSLKNFEFMQSRATFAPSLPEEIRLLLCDAQTSGGLLIAVPEDNVGVLMTRLGEAGESAAVIGRVHAGSGIVQVR